jgi:hypothetical protein
MSLFHVLPGLTPADQIVIEQTDFESLVRWSIDILARCDPLDAGQTTLSFHALRALGALCFDDGSRAFKV